MESEEDDDFQLERYSIESFFSTSDENRRALLENPYGSAEEFLFRSEHIPIRSAYASRLFQDCNLEFDIDFDGCVIELQSFNGLLLPAEHLHLLPYDLGSVKPIYSVLRKHIDLTWYSQSQVKQFKFSVGTQILYSHGWEVWLGFIPDESESSPNYDRDIVQKCAFKSFSGLRQLFGMELRAYVGTGLVRNSLMKTALTKLTKLRLLPDERLILYSLFQNAIEKIDLFAGYKRIVFAFRFGERASKPPELEYFSPDTILNISVHIGCTVKANRGLEILWSRAGLQHVTGDRGSMLTCLSLFEACNWQSNLDGRALDIPQSLRRLCSIGNIRFIQFYADTPHRKYEGKLYPVSGFIVSGGLLPPQMLNSFSEDSERFISVMRENCELLQDLRCRIEIVSWFECVPESFTNILNVTALQQLLAIHPLLVPFFDSDREVINRIQNVIRYLTENLKKFVDDKKCTGEFRASWQAFQLEMALHKLYWGHQPSWLAKQHAINLGPGIEIPSRCQSDQLGFLAFEEATASTAHETSTPPMALWTKNPTYRNRVQRLFGFYDYKDSSNAVVGKRLILLLFGDLLEVYGESKENMLVASCKSIEGKIIVRTLSIESLSNMLSKPRGGNTCYRRAISLLEKSGRNNIEEILFAGILDLSFLSFPAVQLYDKSRNEAFNWNEQNFFRIDSKPEKMVGTEMAVSITEKVVIELEKRKCIYMTKLKCFGDKFAFPWTECILRKLQGGGPSWKKLNDRETVIVLSFLSAVALMEQGWFVPYESLYQLEQACPLSQSTLRSLEIQSQYILCKRGWKNIWRIHPSVPIKIGDGEKKTTKSTSVVRGETRILLPSRNPEEEQKENVTEIQDVVKVPICHLPDSMYRRWSSEELCVLYDVKLMDFLPTVRLKWNKYREACRERGLPDRSLKAFSLKLAKV